MRQPKTKRHEPITDLIKAALLDSKSANRIEAIVWDSLSEKIRERLGRVRLRQLIAVELNDPEQLEFSIEGERFPIAEISPDVLERRGNRLIAIGASLIKRGETYLAEAKRRTEQERA
jgi:hypothetical protein